jgi:putative transcriptional regulator
MESLRGRLLAANGSLYGPVFRQTVILMADHDENGALGFVLNQPSNMIVDVDASLEALPLIDERVFSGGPVQPEAITVLAEFDEVVPGPHVIFDTVGFPSLEQDGTLHVKRARIFAGYSGWGPGQLETELEENSWIVAYPTVDVVFDIEHTEVWSTVLKRMGGNYALLATMPFDPGQN